MLLLIDELLAGWRKTSEAEGSLFPESCRRWNQEAVCAWFVPKDVTSGDLSDFGDLRISNSRILNSG